MVWIDFFFFYGEKQPFLKVFESGWKPQKTMPLDVSESVCVRRNRVAGYNCMFNDFTSESTKLITTP